MKDYWVTVCWQGELECDESSEAGTVEKLASDLRALKIEHPHWYSRSWLLNRGVFIEEVKP